MPDLPLLIFPNPEKASRTILKPGFGKVHFPSHKTQSKRLSPVFQQLQRQFENRRIEVQSTTTGIDPEQALVIETIGSIEKFANAIKKIDGLEWMGEIEVDNIEPDEDFFDEKNKDKKLNGNLYLMMTNQQALDEMLSLWNMYQKDQEMKFQRGLAKFRDVFDRLKDIRRWDVKDRLNDTGIIEAWEEDLKNFADHIKFEIELWFRETREKRRESENEIKEIIKESDGKILHQSNIPEITYHSILAELPRDQIKKITIDRNTKLVKCDNIMFFRPVGQISKDWDASEKTESIKTKSFSLPREEAIIGVLDGLPLQNHQYLAGRITVDDPDGWEDNYQALERIHGTAMTSLIVHGDLNSKESPLPTQVYIRPIMKPEPNSFYSPRIELVPDDILIVDLIHRSVKDLVENGKKSCSSIKIINLSIGDSNRQFIHSMSPLARLIDWLSFEHNILFVISAGNHPNKIKLGNLGTELKKIEPRKLKAETIKAIYKDMRNRKLLSPAESINGLTVGALHYDHSADFSLGNRIDLYDNTLLPSPISAFGNGYRRSVKPEILYFGGKQLYQKTLDSGEDVQVEPIISRRAPGLKVAAPSKLAGKLTESAYSCGTSNAAALISRNIAMCYETLREIINKKLPHVDCSPFIPSLLKAMIVHGSQWGEIGDNLKEILNSNHDKTYVKNLISRWLGYGVPETKRVLNCTMQRASILGFGQLENGEADVFKLPLPSSLSSIREWRRLTVTLAWFSPVLPTTQKYRVASLWFDFEEGIQSRGKLEEKLQIKGIDVDSKATKRGTVQHEIFEGERAVPFTKEETLKIRVNCREEAGKIHKPIAYGLAVSLEVKENIDINIYNEIETRITPAVQIQPVKP